MGFQTDFAVKKHRKYISFEHESDLQVCGTCFIKGKILDNLYLCSRKR